MDTTQLHSTILGINESQLNVIDEQRAFPRTIMSEEQLNQNIPLPALGMWIVSFDNNHPILTFFCLPETGAIYICRGVAILDYCLIVLSAFVRDAYRLNSGLIMFEFNQFLNCKKRIIKW